MFKQLSNTYKWPVTVSVPIDDGKRQDIVVTARFNRIPQSQVDALLNQANEGKATDAEVIAKVVDALGDPVQAGFEFTAYEAADVDAFYELPGARAAVVMAWVESLAKAKTKN